MKTKNEVKNNINLNQYSSLRVKITSKTNAMKFLENVNKKRFGRKVSIDELVSLAFENVTNEDIELLQRKSLRKRIGKIL